MLQGDLKSAGGGTASTNSVASIASHVCTGSSAIALKSRLHHAGHRLLRVVKM